MSLGDFRLAAVLWSDITETSEDPQTGLNLAACRRALGDMDGAMAAVDAVLRRDPRHFMALLMRASLIERSGRTREAGIAYGVALTQAPPDAHLDEPTRRAVAHARAANSAYAAEMHGFLMQRAASRAAGPGPDARRVDAFVDLMAGRRKNYRQEPVGYFYPGLPAIEFWDREEFPWLAELEAATGDIREELRGVMATPTDEFTPYVDYPDNTPLDQWEALNRSRRWGAFHLREYGKPVAANIARCPKTYAVLQRLPQPEVPNRSPAAMFSVLEPRTHIPPHTGVSNTRLVVHLPLIVPEGCRFRVGNETRTYTDGQAWVFDDTIEHEAWNDSDETRIILLFDVWNPRLSLWEREMIAELSGAMDEFSGSTPPTSPQKL